MALPRALVQRLPLAKFVATAPSLARAHCLLRPSVVAPMAVAAPAARVAPGVPREVVVQLSEAGVPEEGVAMLRTEAPSSPPQTGCP